MIAKGWGNPEGLCIVDLSINTFLCNFSNEELPVKFRWRPSKCYGLLLNPRGWISEITLHEIDIARSPYWVQILRDPLQSFTIKNASHIGGKFGKVLINCGKSYSEQHYFEEIPSCEGINQYQGTIHDRVLGCKESITYNLGFSQILETLMIFAISMVVWGIRKKISLIKEKLKATFN